MVKEHGKTRQQLGGLSNAVGYNLEDGDIGALPALLLREFGLEVKGKLRRGLFERSQRQAHRDEHFRRGRERGAEVFDCRGSQDSTLQEGVDEFLKKRLAKPEALELFPVMITYMTVSLDVVDYAGERGIKRVYFSHEL